MGEAVVQRDERGRIAMMTIQSDGMSDEARVSVMCMLRAVAESLRDYLHVDPESSFDEDRALVSVNRTDQHLDREINAVLATAVQALRIVEREHPDELIVHDVAVEVEV